MKHSMARTELLSHPLKFLALEAVSYILSQPRWESEAGFLRPLPVPAKATEMFQTGQARSKVDCHRKLQLTWRLAYCHPGNDSCAGAVDAGVPWIGRVDVIKDIEGV